MKYALLVAAVLLLGACSTTKLVPQAYMPAPPSILMRPPVELNTIKQEEPQPEPQEEENPDETL